MRKTAGEFRIIGGQWRGRKLPVLDSEGLRPTTDRVRETLFNWLQFDLADATVLDLFAGSGSLAFEAASRGAASVTMIEREHKVVQQLRANIATLNAAQNIQVRQQDALVCLADTDLPQPLDVVFVDPPFNQGLAEKALAALVTASVVDEHTLVYLEVEKDLALDLSQWQTLKEKQHGNVNFRLLQLNA